MGERVLVTTLTKRTAENLTRYLAELGVRVRYLRSEVEGLGRTAIPAGPRRGSAAAAGGEVEVTDPASLAKAIAELEKRKKAAAKRLEFGEAGQLRDRIKELRAQHAYRT